MSDRRGARTSLWRANVALGALALLLVGSAAAQDWPNGERSPFERSPIHILLDLSNLTAQNADYEAEVREAMAWWESGGNGALQFKVAFREVATREEADIVLWFRDAGRSGPVCGFAEDAAGCARPFERPVPIELVAREPDGNFRSYAAIREVAKHELGHALGLPHSDAPGDIMAPHVARWASDSWRPGDWERLPLALGLLGAVVLVVVGGFVLALRRPRAPEVQPFAPGEREAPCPGAGDGLHRLAPMELRVEDRLEPWLVCAGCRRAMPLTREGASPR